MHLSTHFELTGSYDLKIWNIYSSLMLRFCTARLNGMDAKYASYSFMQEFTILARSDYLERATKRMNKVDMDLL